MAHGNAWSLIYLSSEIDWGLAVAVRVRVQVRVRVRCSSGSALRRSWLDEVLSQSGSKRARALSLTLALAPALTPLCRSSCPGLNVTLNDARVWDSTSFIFFIFATMDVTIYQIILGEFGDLNCSLMDAFQDTFYENVSFSLLNIDGTLLCVVVRV